MALYSGATVEALHTSRTQINGPCRLTTKLNVGGDRLLDRVLAIQLVRMARDRWWAAEVGKAGASRRRATFACGGERPWALAPPHGRGLVQEQRWLPGPGP
eukprot:CAMPEP_0168456956 /NCGR_PEP_ID=MMETSP0228-20121227/51574_1 /TAXON_ID=133427 /ORGANISM="Protoceratium reticulatum, Strain CCCM 535 (=CCMP 1889)" /LENGTH=100 /DNA_ID=CAMNT_0008471931 /DNA_START=73 /DNA_END=371 /DNA_ORIENTATION=+